MCLASIYDMSADELIAHLESLLRARRERQTTSPAAAPDLPPDCLPPWARRGRRTFSQRAEAHQRSHHMNIYRQGDVLIRQIDKLPKDAMAVPNKGRIVLAYGEVTGHAHAIDVAEATEYSMADAAGAVRRFLAVVSSATVKHEEHAAIPLPAGVYEIVQQREYSPEEIRNVAD